VVTEPKIDEQYIKTGKIYYITHMWVTTSKHETHLRRRCALTIRASTGSIARCCSTTRAGLIEPALHRMLSKLGWIPRLSRHA